LNFYKDLQSKFHHLKFWDFEMLKTDSAAAMENILIMNIDINGPLKSIHEKALASERLSFEDGVTLYNSHDLISIGKIANLVRERKNGKNAFYTMNQHINPSNICRNNCLFCAYYRKEGGKDAYRMSMESVRGKVMERIDEDIRELHIVGALDDGLPYDYYIDIIREVKKLRPEVSIKAYTAVEIAYLAERTGKSRQQVLQDLKDAGLQALPGGGAEVFSRRVQKKLFKDKLNAQDWIEIHQLAHSMDIRTNATMLYGHIETIEERVEHFIKLREAQDSSGGFLTFIPLAFHPENTKVHKLPGPTGITDLKMIAVSRLMLDNFDHIKAYWVVLSTGIAQTALSFGADDIDGSVVEEKIYHMAGSKSAQMMTRMQLENLIKETGCIPIERDALYNKVTKKAAG